jgi:A/G-specific adenine glycosylase
LRVQAIRNGLKRWYQAAKRDLPWRRTRDPYAIWISEIMLQQTRVAVVIPYYLKFLSAFPDAGALAHADEDLVLSMWSGLGYYSRARNLKKAAQQVCADGFPRDYESIRALAGVGDYTAAAVASIAFGLPYAAVDGNVRRVIARLSGDGNADFPKLANNLLDRRDPGVWNQAMMELGATMCLPRDPLCGACPVAKSCEARASGTQHELPLRKVKPETVRLSRTLIVVRRDGRILLAPGERVAGFWDLPETLAAAKLGPVVGEFGHSITHHRYRFVVREGIVKGIPKGFRWFAEDQLHEIPLSTTAKKALRCLKRT